MNLSSPIPTASLKRLLYHIDETAQILGISRASVYRLVNKGQLDRRKILGRAGITAASIERLLAALPKV